MFSALISTDFSPVGYIDNSGILVEKPDCSWRIKNHQFSINRSDFLNFDDETSSPNALNNGEIQAIFILNEKLH